MTFVRVNGHSPLLSFNFRVATLDSRGRTGTGKMPIPQNTKLLKSQAHLCNAQKGIPGTGARCSHCSGNKHCRTTHDQ
ncbi:MAG: hypothetical protein F6K17_15365 [Okeania sp. SIO3C4]|nr:hypothetical protein [Okeania sp. SIO3C4]